AWAGIHLALVVCVRRAPPAATIDRRDARVALLDRLVTRQRAECGHRSIRAKEGPQALGADSRERTFDPDRAPKPDDVLGPVGSNDSRPPLVLPPARVEFLGAPHRSSPPPIPR